MKNGRTKKKKEKRCLQGGRCKQSMTGMFHSLNEGFPVSYNSQLTRGFFARMKNTYKKQKRKIFYLKKTKQIAVNIAPISDCSLLFVSVTHQFSS